MSTDAISGRSPSGPDGQDRLQERVYSKEYEEYCSMNGEWPELKQKLYDVDVIDALTCYLMEPNENDPLSVAFWRKTWWKHDLAAAVYGIDVVWWDFPSYNKWIWIVIMCEDCRDLIENPNRDLDCPYVDAYDFPLAIAFTGCWEPLDGLVRLDRLGSALV